MLSEPTPQRVLAVDDEPDILLVVRASLVREGFEVTTASSAEEAMTRISEEGLPHIGVFDIMMPGTNGIELARELQTFCDLPVIMLTAVDAEDTVISAIDEVAEDYLVKPFNPKELVARVKRVLRRLGDYAYAVEPITRIDDRLAVDFAGRAAIVGGERVQLTPTETKILHIFVRSAGRTVTTDFLLRRVWPLEEVFEDTLRVHVHRLRQKLESEPGTPVYLTTERGLGYSFRPAPA